MLAVLSYPIILMFAFDKTVLAGPWLMIAGILIPLTVVIKHKDNIVRLFKGTESRIPPFFKSKTATQ
jgi:glycerol-3-phosphate acyltransferase PlsY